MYWLNETMFAFIYEIILMCVCIHNNLLLNPFKKPIDDEK